MNAKLTEDLSAVSNIPKLTLDKLLTCAESLMAATVSDSIKEGSSTSVIDLVFGQLYIKLEDDSIKYKFVPSTSLNTAIKQVATGGENPVIKKLEKALAEKIESAYKNLL